MSLCRKETTCTSTRRQRKWLVKEYGDDSGIIFAKHGWNSANSLGKDAQELLPSKAWAGNFNCTWFPPLTVGYWLKRGASRINTSKFWHIRFCVIVFKILFIVNECCDDIKIHFNAIFWLGKSTLFIYRIIFINLLIYLLKMFVFMLLSNKFILPIYIT